MSPNFPFQPQMPQIPPGMCPGCAACVAHAQISADGVVSTLGTLGGEPCDQIIRQTAGGTPQKPVCTVIIATGKMAEIVAKAGDKLELIAQQLDSPPPTKPKRPSLLQRARRGLARLIAGESSVRKQLDREAREVAEKNGGLFS